MAAVPNSLARRPSRIFPFFVARGPLLPKIGFERWLSTQRFFLAIKFTKSILKCFAAHLKELHGTLVGRNPRLGSAALEHNKILPYLY